MTPAEMKSRTKQFALRCMKLCHSLPQDAVSRTIASQFVRAATSVGANYRAACRARSSAEFVSKLGIVEEEADECGYWLELIIGGDLLSARLVKPLLVEADELLRIVVASITTARGRRTKAVANPQSAIPNPQSP